MKTKFALRLWVCVSLVLAATSFAQTPATGTAQTGTGNNGTAGGGSGGGGDPIKKTCEQGKAPTGSFIAFESQTYNTEVDLAGTPWRLHYTSLRAEGRAAGYAQPVRVTPATIATNLEHIEVEWTVAGKTVRTNYAATTNLVYACAWDGTDGQSNAVTGGRIGVSLTSYTVWGPFGGPTCPPVPNSPSPSPSTRTSCP
jgi:hypothetical protein